MGRPRAGALLAAVLCCVPVGCTAPDTSPRSADTSRPAGPAPSPVPVLPAGVRYQEVTRHVGAGEPVRLYVLRVEPDARARVVAVHGDGMDRGDTVRSLARRAGALFAVNGTYFDVGRGGTGGGGDPIGLYAENGRVLSEALAGRPALLLGRDDGGLDARVTEVSTTGRMRAADGARRAIDGVNRTAGRVPGCGGTGGDRNATDGRPMTQPSRGCAPTPTRSCSSPPSSVDGPRPDRPAVPNSCSPRTERRCGPAHPRAGRCPRAAVRCTASEPAPGGCAPTSVPAPAPPCPYGSPIPGDGG